MHDLELTHLLHDKFGHMGGYSKREGFTRGGMESEKWGNAARVKNGQTRD
jgi:hypothetical protein